MVWTGSLCPGLLTLLGCGEHSNEFLGYAKDWNKSWAAVNTVKNVG